MYKIKSSRLYLLKHNHDNLRTNLYKGVMNYSKQNTENEHMKFGKMLLSSL